MSRFHRVLLVNIMTKFHPFLNFLRVRYLSTGQSGYKNCAMPSCTSFYAHKTALQVTRFNWPVEKPHRHQKVETEMLKTKTKKKRQKDGEKQCESQLGRWGEVLNNVYYGEAAPRGPNPSCCVCCPRFSVLCNYDNLFIVTPRIARGTQ